MGDWLFELLEGEVKPLGIPTWKWNSISIDFGHGITPFYFKEKMSSV